MTSDSRLRRGSFGIYGAEIGANCVANLWRFGPNRNRSVGSASNV